MRLITMFFFVVGLTVTGCGPKADVNVTPHGQAVLKADKIVTALSDFQDGVAASFYSGYLSGSVTLATALVVRDAVVAIHQTPEGAKATALAAIDSIQAQLTANPDLNKFIPYLISVRAVLGGL